MSPSRPKISGLPGRIATFQNVELHAERVQRGRDEIVIADGGAADGDEHVGVGARSPSLSARSLGVARDAEDARRGSGRCRQRGKADRVGGDDLIGARQRAGRHQLVAGRQNGDAGAPADGNLAVAHRGGERERVRVEHSSGVKQLVRRRNRCRGADIGAGCRGFADDDLVAFGGRVLLDDDGIAARRHGAPVKMRTAWPAESVPANR